MNTRFKFDVSRWKTQRWPILATLLIFAVPASLAMPPERRLLAFAILTGAVLIAVIYELNKKEAGRVSLIASFALIWLGGAAILYLANRFAPQTEEISGALIPGAAKTPVTSCGSDKFHARNDLLMIFGGNAAIGRGNGPFVPVRIGSCPALRITRTQAGLMVNAFGFDSDDNVVYRIKDNKFEQVIGGFLQAHRPDRSTLVVSDDRGVETLTIHFLNANTVQVRGTFRCGNTKPVRITNDSVLIGGILVTKKQCVVMNARTPYGLEYSYK